MLKQQKMIRQQNINAPKNPFKAALSHPAKATRINETFVPMSHILSASSILDKSIMTNRLSCSSTKIGELSSVHSEKRGKPCSTIQKPLVTDDMSYHARKPKYFLNYENKSQPF